MLEDGYFTFDSDFWELNMVDKLELLVKNMSSVVDMLSKLSVHNLKLLSFMISVELDLRELDNVEFGIKPNRFDDIVAQLDAIRAEIASKGEK